MVTDEEALRKQFRKPNVRPRSNPEEIDKPKEVLKDVYRRNGKKYIARRELPKIIEHIDLDILRQKCPSFREFEESLNSVSQ